MLCGEFYFGPHVSWLFSEASTLIHLHTDAREDCPELDALLNILVRESLAQRPGGSAIVRSLGDTLLVLPAAHAAWRATAARRAAAPDER